jgi:hypothetical protein
VQSAHLIRRAAGVADRVGRGSSRWCFGRYICLSCPRDRHLPPFLPFALPIHRREHRARYPHHTIRWWCWDHCQIEPEGGDAVTLPYPADQVRIGACLRCNAIFLVTPTNQNHLICGEPAAYTMPFPVSGSAEPSAALPADFPEALPETPSVFSVSCPSCEANLDLTITEEVITLTLPPPGIPAGEADGAPANDAPAAPPPAPAPDGSAGQQTESAGVDPNIPAEPSPSDPEVTGYVSRDMYPTQPESAAADSPEPVP